MKIFGFIKVAFVAVISLFVFMPQAAAKGVFDTYKNKVKTPLDWSQRQEKKAPDSKTREAVKKFSDENGKNWTVRYNPQTGAPESIMNGRSSKRYFGKVKDRSDAFLKDNSSMLGIEPSNLKKDGENSFLGMSHVRYQQYYKGIPVEFSYVKVHMDDSGEVTGYQSSYNKEISVDINPAITLAQAMQAANADAGAVIRVSSHSLVIYPDFNKDAAYLAWKIRGRSYDGRHIWVYYVDAHSGKVIFSYDDMRRAACDGIRAKAKGSVYDISPVPHDSFPFYSQAATNWQNNFLMLKDFGDEYIWIKDYKTKMVTNESGLGCSTAAVRYNESTHQWIADGTVQGKFFSALKGPYFTVTNMRGQSAHWDNGGGHYYTATLNTPIQSPSPYPNDSLLSWTSSIPELWEEGQTFAKMYPLFASPFSVGQMEDTGDVTDADEVFVEDAFGTRAGSYLGSRSASFLGPSIESPRFAVRLKTDSSGQGQGFSISRSTYIALNTSPSAPYPNTSTGDYVHARNIINWSTTTSINYGLYYLDSSLGATGTFGIDEPNVFYHLNKMRRYFMQFNKLRKSDGTYCPVGIVCTVRPVNLDGHVDVMVHANGRPNEMFSGTMSERDGMANAFYDLENNNIFFGDGYYDGVNLDPKYYAYRSFALDGTIIRHEYTHYVVHQIYNIINFGEFGAISEALSDYFSLASFWQEGDNHEGYYFDKNSLTKVGNFVTDTPRDLSLGDKKLTLNWNGELYNDSQILSQALYSLRKGDYALGPEPPNDIKMPNASTWGAVPVADLVVWASLFYFPDSFRNLYEAMYDVCGRLNDKWPSSCEREKIQNAFADHELITGGSVSTSDNYEAAAGGLCQNNNGPECAADITEVRTLNARIYPKGDLDYYTFTANAGPFIAEMTLPDNGNYMYHGYMFTLFDSNRNQLAEVIPRLNSSDTSDYCFSDEPCLSVDYKVNLSYNLPKSGRYYLAVTAAPSTYDSGWGISPENSVDEYVLKTSFPEQGHVTASINRAESTFDNDLIQFIAPVVISAAGSSNIVNDDFYDKYSTNNSETSFSYVQLWDIQGNKLVQASTNYTPAADRLIELTDTPSFYSTGTISGNFRILPGFSRRYPAVGSVVVEVLGKNHMGSQISLGKSLPVNLTSASSRFEAYNNILLKGNGEAIIRYAATGNGNLTIKAYTQTGKLVKVIADRYVSAGEQGNETWDGTNEKGSKVASGIYFIKAKGPGLDKVEKIAVVR